MDASSQRGVVFKKVGETQLGEFVGIASASDGGAWIGGTRGIAKLGPYSSQNPDSISWEEHLFPAEFRIEGFFSPAEGKQGTVYGLSGLPREYDLDAIRSDLGKAFQSLLTLYLKQAVVTFDGQSFELDEIAPVNGVPVEHLHDSMTARGFIGFQVHSFQGDSPAQVRWRNIRVREL